MAMIYKCTSNQCNCAAVPARTFEGGWECLACRAVYHYYRNDAPPLAPGNVLDAADEVFGAFDRIDPLHQREVIQELLRTHARALGKAGLAFFELNIQEMLDEYNGAKGDPCKK